MDPKTRSFIIHATNAHAVKGIDTIQELWSGYGRILRVRLDHPSTTSAILKSIDPPVQVMHPRGWNTKNSHQRKLFSYRCEATWYQQYAKFASGACRMPVLLGNQIEGDRVLLLLEDLDSEFPLRCGHLSLSQTCVCLDWLAEFHANYMGVEPQGLWSTGTYWHLNTRPDELNDMQDGHVKAVAHQLDHALENCRYKTLVHGDAKVANFCFAENLDSVAAVDFQYVGGGCGIRDVAYLLGSCLSEDECEIHESTLLDHYFSRLGKALESKLSALEIRAVIEEWQGLYAIAWTDFYRFLLGWMPDHPKINRYTMILAERAIDDLETHNT